MLGYKLISEVENASKEKKLEAYTNLVIDTWAALNTYLPIFEKMHENMPDYKDSYLVKMAIDRCKELKMDLHNAMRSVY